MQRKLRLDIDTLEVESFTTANGTEERGTVHGRATAFCNTVDHTCDGANTCGGLTCNRAMNSCALSCDACGTYKCGGEGDSLVCGSDGSGITGCQTCLVNC